MIQTETLEGQAIPSLTLQSSEGRTVRLPDDLKGQWTVLYFYPKDDTPGCTKQACSYRDHLSDFQKIGARVYGVSADDLKSHDAFVQKYSLNFPLLSDPERKLTEALGARSEKGISRDTFLIDPDAKIRKVWRKVDPTTTMSETYETLQQML